MRFWCRWGGEPNMILLSVTRTDERKKKKKRYRYGKFIWWWFLYFFFLSTFLCGLRGGVDGRIVKMAWRSRAVRRRPDRRIVGCCSTADGAGGHRRRHRVGHAALPDRHAWDVRRENISVVSIASSAEQCRFVFTICRASVRVCRRRRRIVLVGF